MAAAHGRALTATPLFLRLAVGVIFLYAGLAKIADTATFEPDTPAYRALTEMGVIAPAGHAPPPVPPAEPSPQAHRSSAWPPARTTAPGSATAWIHVAGQPGGPTAGGTTTSVSVRAVYRLAVGVRGWAQPDPGQPRLLPAWMGQGGWPVYVAWAVAVVELGGGACVLLGLLTRIAALALASVMVGALWLTEIGPDVLAGTARLGFLPAKPLLGGDWQRFMLQFALLCSALALATGGGGRASLDRLVFGES